MIWRQGAGNVSAVQAGLEHQRLPQSQSSVMYRHRGRIRLPPVMEIALASPFSCNTGVLLFFSRAPDSSPTMVGDESGVFQPIRGQMRICRCLIYVLLIPTLLFGVDSYSQNNKFANVLSVSAQAKELAQGYLAWLHQHPELRAGSGSNLAQSGKAGDPYKILWPTLDIYSRAGLSFFHGNDSDTNIKIIQHLPHQVPLPDPMTARRRPTLEEALAMFPEIPSRAGNPPAQIKYTVFVINYADRPSCAAQDQAIRALKKRVAGSQIRIIEVRL